MNNNNKTSYFLLRCWTALFFVWFLVIFHGKLKHSQFLREVAVERRKPARPVGSFCRFKATTFAFNVRLPSRENASLVSLRGCLIIFCHCHSYTVPHHHHHHRICNISSFTSQSSVINHVLKALLNHTDGVQNSVLFVFYRNGLKKQLIANHLMSKTKKELV